MQRKVYVLARDGQWIVLDEPDGEPLSSHPARAEALFAASSRARARGAAVEVLDSGSWPPPSQLDEDPAKAASTAEIALELQRLMRQVRETA